MATSWSFNTAPFNEQILNGEPANPSAPFGGALNDDTLNTVPLNGYLPADFTPIYIPSFAAITFKQVVGREPLNTQVILRQIVNLQISTGGESVIIRQNVASNVISTNEVVRFTQIVSRDYV